MIRPSGRAFFGAGCSSKTSYRPCPSVLYEPEVTGNLPRHQAVCAFSFLQSFQHRCEIDDFRSRQQSFGKIEDDSRFFCLLARGEFVSGDPVNQFLKSSTRLPYAGIEHGRRNSFLSILHRGRCRDVLRGCDEREHAAAKRLHRAGNAVAVMPSCRFFRGFRRFLRTKHGSCIAHQDE